MPSKRKVSPKNKKARCFRCKVDVTIKNPTLSKTSKSHMLKGTCSKCGGKVCTFVKKTQKSAKDGVDALRYLLHGLKFQAGLNKHYKLGSLDPIVPPPSFSTEITAPQVTLPTYY